MPNAYFENCLNEKIAINLNSNLDNQSLSARQLERTSSSSVVILKGETANFVAQANLDKNKFGSGNNQKNTVVITYTSQANTSTFYITTSELSGQDLYFYVFADGIVGKDAYGNSRGIVVEAEVAATRKIQGSVHALGHSDMGIQIKDRRPEEVASTAPSNQQNISERIINMPTAYFCNCVPENISVNLNLQLSNVVVEPRAVQSQPLANSLSMAEFPIDAVVGKGVFGQTAVNQVTVRFAALNPGVAVFDIQVDSGVTGDLFFYVFGNTLVGQQQDGLSAGISIEAQETVKRVIQSGNEKPPVRIPLSFGGSKDLGDLGGQK